MKVSKTPPERAGNPSDPNEVSILFLSSWYPVPTDNGAKIRIFNLLQGLASRYEVDLVSFRDASRPAPGSGGDVPWRSVSVVPGIRYRPFAPRSLLGFVTAMPRWLYATRSEEMERQIRGHLRQRDYRLVIASEWKTAVYARCFGKVPALFEDPEIGPLVTKAQSALGSLSRLRHRLPLLKLKVFLSHLLPLFSACTVVSEPERRLMRAFGPGGTRVEVVPNFLDCAGYESRDESREPNSLIFTGSFSFEPNYRAMLWFVEEILPLIRRQIPGASLTVTGDHQGKSLPRSNAVRLTGYVDSVKPLLARAQVAVVPIREGGGTRLKILEAMASGVAVVSTRKGAEGLEVRDQESIGLADSPRAFANAVVRLLRNPGLRQATARKALRLVQENYDKDRVVPVFLDIVDSIVRGSRCR